MVAVDRDDIVVGLSHGARQALGLGNHGPFSPKPLADLLADLRASDDAALGYPRGRIITQPDMRLPGAAHAAAGEERAGGGAGRPPPSAPRRCWRSCAVA